jgi:hypothetical protein
MEEAALKRQMAREEAALKRKKAREEAALKRQKAADNFLENSGINLAGWGGGLSAYDGHVSGGAGGAEIGLGLSRYFCLQTGFTIFEEEGKLFSDSYKTKLRKVTQIPFLARLDLNLEFSAYPGEPIWKWAFSAYSGIGKNFSSAGDVTLLSSPPLSFIAGVEIGAGGKLFGGFGGYQFQHDFSATKYSYGGQNFSYNGSRHIWRVGMSWYIPFRRK